MIACKECGVLFESDKALHLHLRKHKLKVKGYYERHYPMTCLQTRKKLQWKSGDDLQSYLGRRFIDRTSLYQYFEDASDFSSRADLLVSYLEDFYVRHGVAPCQMELSSLPIYPTLLTVEKYFNYAKFCADRNWKTHFDYSLDYSKTLPIPRVDAKEVSVIIDTREQMPLRLFSSVRGKLDVGDYALSGDLHRNTYIERKSVADFWGTMASAIDKSGESTRFQRELERARQTNSYLIILCEYSLDALEKYRGYGYASYPYIVHNMRNIFRQFSDCCQFVFTINREISAKLLMEFLLCRDIRKYDLQLWIDCHYPPFRTQEFTREDFEHLFDGEGV